MPFYQESREPPHGVPESGRPSRLDLTGPNEPIYCRETAIERKAGSFVPRVRRLKPDLQDSDRRLCIAAQSNKSSRQDRIKVFRARRLAQSGYVELTIVFEYFLRRIAPHEVSLTLTGSE